MSKAILISIKPKYVAKILNGEKTIEIRKTMPKCDLPIDVYIYCTKDGYLHLENNGEWSYSRNQKYTYIRTGKVVARFTLNKVEEITTSKDRFKEFIFYETSLDMEDLLKESCLDYNELDNYLYGYKGYVWNIDNLVIFDRPKELREFYKKGYLDYIKPCEHPRYPETYKDFYKSVLKVAKHKFKLTKAPQSYQFIEVEE